MHLWTEACNTIVYLHNKSPHRILGTNTLEEDFSGRKLDVSHFRIFGAYVYYHVSKESRKKLKPTTYLGVFVSYIEAPCNYRVCFPSLIMTTV